MHKNQKFKVAITQWNPRSPGFTIKHKDEPAFVISYDHIWPYLHEAQQQHVLDQGGTPSNNSEEVLAQYGSGGNGKSVPVCTISAMLCFWNEECLSLEDR